jgi:hypothetical protein
MSGRKKGFLNLNRSKFGKMIKREAVGRTSRKYDKYGKPGISKTG